MKSSLKFIYDEILIPHSPENISYQLRYFKHHKKICNYRHPKRFSEKLFHRMRYPSPVLSRLSDKLLARDYIGSVIGAGHLVPLVGVYRRITGDDLEKMEGGFVIKANHGSGHVRVVADGRAEDLPALAREANAWLDEDFSARHGERHYKAITPMLIVEEALLEDGAPPADFKCHVFNPGPAEAPFVYVQVIRGRFGRQREDIYLESWIPAPFRNVDHEQNEGYGVDGKPGLFDEMVGLAKRLASPFGYCRVDCYLHAGRVFVGELTFTPAAGMTRFDPPEWDLLLGRKFGWPEAAWTGDPAIAGAPAAS